MTPLFMIAVLFVTAISVPRRLIFSPQMAYELGFLSKEPPQCRAEKPFEAHELNSSESGKAALFSLRSRAICPRPIFANKDRNSYYNFVFKNIDKKLSQLGRQAIILVKNVPNSGDYFWTIQTQDSVPTELESYLLAVMQVTLAEELGASRVIRKGVVAKPYIKLSLGTREVVDPDLLFLAELQIVGDEKVLTWQL